uniref:Uncharacterized protein n=1 Tax=Arundo donax TaxID=35708 RepID=A0A0A9DRS3_ARUDO
MPTSFAPSPIANVTLPVPFLTSLVTRAFCLGEERQQMTEPQPIARSRNMPLASSSSAYISDFPSIIKANVSSADAFMSFFPSFICRTTLSFDALVMAALSLSLSNAFISAVSSVTIICFIPCLSRLLAYPMLMAVSILSPVSTHILMPA